MIKRGLSDQVSNEYINEIYGEAKSAGAIGGKLTGAGGGGFMLLFVPPSCQKAVRERLSKLVYVPFKIEFSGSQIIFFEPDPDYSVEEKDRNGHPIEPFRELNKSPLMD
jgi:D-glycero-alpha-D-manno-heptose-7-phosphate kinase